MITIIYQFKHNVTWHCRINQFFSFPEQLQIWIYVFLVGDHRYIYMDVQIKLYIHTKISNIFLNITIKHLNVIKYTCIVSMYIYPGDCN